MAVVKDMISQVESEHHTKLEQLHSLHQENRSTQFTLHIESHSFTLHNAYLINCLALCGICFSSIVLFFPKTTVSLQFRFWKSWFWFGSVRYLRTCMLFQFFYRVWCSQRWVHLRQLLSH